MARKGPARDNDAIDVWRQVGELMVRGQSRIDTRLDHLEGDVAVLKTDVHEIKTDIVGLKIDVSEMKGQLNRFELALYEIKLNSEAQFERLAGLIGRNERGN